METLEVTSTHGDDRLPRPPTTGDDIKGAAVFLASDASAFVTGATLRADGGISAVYPVKALG